MSSKGILRPGTVVVPRGHPIVDVAPSFFMDASTRIYLKLQAIVPQLNEHCVALVSTLAPPPVLPKERSFPKRTAMDRFIGAFESLGCAKDTVSASKGCCPLARTVSRSLASLCSLRLIEPQY